MIPTRSRGNPRALDVATALCIGTLEKTIIGTITLPPLMAPLMVVIGMLRFIDAFKVFDTIYTLTAGDPGTSTEVTSLLAYRMSFEQWRIGESAAFAVLVWIGFFVLCSVFYYVAKKKLNAF
jgi:multiple sugar transport system permease protein